MKNKGSYIQVMKKIKVVLDEGVYSIKPNDGNKDMVVFECETRKEWTDYLTNLPNPPKYIVVSTLVQNL
jgi:hypothetical protein